MDDLDDEQLDLKEHPADPDYNRTQPWENAANADYDDVTREFIKTKRRYKALCYEDVQLWIVQNPMPGKRDLVAMEITLKYHKGADRKPKP